MPSSFSFQAAHPSSNAGGPGRSLSMADAEVLLGTMPWGVLILAPDGTVALLNPVAEDLWGVPAAAVLGHAPAQVQPAVLPPELLQALAQPAEADPAATYWLPHTQQWIGMRTAPAADGGRWVYWDNVTAAQQATRSARKHRTRQRHTRELLAAVEEVAHSGSYEADLATMAFRFSDGMYRLFGEAPGAFTPSLEFIDARSHPDDIAPVMQVLEQAVADQQPYHYQRRIYLPNGQLRTLEAHGQVICNKAGTPVKLRGLVQDVTERLQAEAEVLRAQQALAQQATDQYRALFLALDQGYFLAEVEFDEHGQPADMLYLDANPAATRMMGQDFTGRRLKELNPRYEAYWYDIFGRVARSGVSERLEQFAEPDQKWYDFNVFRVGDEASRRVAVVFQDITARKQNEQALRESKAQIAADLAGMRRLYELQAKLANQNDAQAALRDVLAAACELTGTDRGCVQLLSNDGERLEMAVWQGYADDSPFISFFRYEGLATGCEVTRVQRQRLIIEDTGSFPGLDGTDAGAATYADDIRAAQSTPMAGRAGETIGVISTQFRQPHRPSDHELRLLDMLAWTAAEFLERHRADAARRESEQQFRQMADAVPQIVWLTDAEGRTEFFNKQWSDYTGVPYEPTTAAEVAARFVHPDDAAATMAAFTEARATGTTFQVEHRIRSKTGDYRWFLVRAEPYRDANTGKIIRWFGASVDIHDRKQAEIALEKAHARLQLAMNIGRIFSFEMNPATRALELSDNVDTVIGFPLPDHIDSTFELIHPDDLQPTIDLINGAINSRGSYSSEYRLVNPANGEVVWFHSQAAFSRINASDEWRFVGIAQNITESKRAQEALRASEEKYRTLFETMDQGFAVCELLRDETGRANDFRYLELNPAWEHQTGLSRDLALRSTANQLVPGLEDRLVQTFARVVETGEPTQSEYYVGPLKRWYHYLAFPQGGQRFAVLYDDITDRKKAEEVLQQSASRQLYLLTLSDALSSVMAAVDIQAAVTDTAMHYFQADRCYYCEIAGDTVTIRRDAARPGLPSVAAVYSLSTMPIFRAMLQESQPVAVHDVHTSADMDDNLKQLCLGFGIVAYINVPVIKNGEQVGMLCLTQGTPREWTALEIALVQETAERTWAAVERARAEEALRASEALLQKAFSIDTVSLLFFTLDGRMTAANQAFVRMSGYSQEALLTTDWEMLTAPEFWDVTERAAGELADRGETAPYEKQFVRPDGSRWWGLCAPTRLKGHGPAAECVEFIIDISESKQAEEQLRAFSASLEQVVAERTQALRESKELLQSVFDTSLISMSVLEAVRDEAGVVQDFRIAIANKELEKETGRTDLVGKLYSQEYPGIKQTGLYDLMLGVLETGEPAGMEYFYPYEGFDKWYQCQFVKRGDALVATNLDISERKLAEEKIREQAHFIARVNETLPDLMTVTEATTGQVLYVNRDPDEAPGFEREKLLNIPLEAQTDLLRMHPDDAARLPDYFARAAALADHEIATFSYRAKLNTDRWRCFQVRGSVFQRDPATGAATRILSVAQDVTTQKEAEMQQAKSYQLLRESEKAAGLGSWEYDFATGQLEWSEGLYRLFGLAPGSPIGPSTYLDFAVAEDRPIAERIVQGLTTGRTSFEETLRIRVGDTVKTLRVKATGTFDEAGAPRRMLGVDHDISEVQRLEAENLHMRLTQQQAMFRAVLEAQETERRRIAESLHNGLGQILYATKLQLNQMQAGPAPNALHRADQLLSDAIRQTRTLSHELVPTVLSEFGLEVALSDVCRTLSSPHLRIACTVELEEPLPQPLQLAVFRMAQELVQNVVKHARATSASLALETVPGFVLLRAEDNGVGFAPGSASNRGIGLRTIRDQVALLGGTLDLGSSPEFGTFVRIRFPLPTPVSPPA